MTREEYPYMHTFWHHKFRVGWPLEEDVCIEDIAHSLSLLCRFTGHVKQFYSVGEHSVRVSYLCPAEHQLWGLLHDAGESYAGDVNRPLKYSPGMEAYRAYEKNVQQVISLRYNLLMEEPKEVKAADDRLLVTEQRDLMWGVTSAGNVQKERLHGILPLFETIVPWTTEQTERTFLMRFSELTGVKEFYKSN
jgi:5'-deoxynucleotidase YfbR-like HD superfamily hydrolase